MLDQLEKEVLMDIKEKPENQDLLVYKDQEDLREKKEFQEFLERKDQLEMWEKMESQDQ